MHGKGERAERPTYRRTPNFRADASRKSGSSLGAGVELGESFSAPAGAASNALGGGVAAGFGRRKISRGLGDILRARTTVVAPIRSEDSTETSENSGKCEGGGGGGVSRCRAGGGPAPILAPSTIATIATVLRPCGLSRRPLPLP